MELQAGRYWINLDGEMEGKRFRGDVVVSYGSWSTRYEDVDFDDISCISEGNEKLREAYVMGISEDLKDGTRIFDDKWRNGFCLFRYFSKVSKD